MKLFLKLKHLVKISLSFLFCFLFIHTLAFSKNKNISPTKTQIEIAYLGGGCFWGMQDLLRTQKGVIKTEVGYMGDSTPSPKYELVKSGKTNFAETVMIQFNPQVLNYSELLSYFFKIHDPTTLNQQGNDIGVQYRSVIFYTSDHQKQIAEKLIDKINKSKVWKNPIVTKITPSQAWTKAEDYHQDYLQKNPQGYTCHFERQINIPNIN